MNREFIAAIVAVRPGDKFFVLCPEVQYDAADGISRIGRDLFEAEIRDGFVECHDIQTIAQTWRFDITEKLAGELSKRQRMRVEQGLAPWLAALDIKPLQLLLAERCLMDLSGLFLTDVDVVVVEEGRSLEMAEFKRKDPANEFGYRHTQDRRVRARISILRVWNEQKI